MRLHVHYPMRGCITCIHKAIHKVTFIPSSFLLVSMGNLRGESEDE